MSDKKDYRLPRTRENDLAFTGAIVREVSGRMWGGRERNRWYELAVYDVGDGDYVCAATLHTQWQGEADWHEAAVS